VSGVEKEIDVLERVWQPKRVLAAWRQVKKNAGAAGIDQMSVDEFAEHKTELLRGAIAKLRDGTYRFKPARRVLIPKPGKPGKFRKLGIPVVLDRVVAQSIHTVLEEIFDPGFSASNYGFRKGKSQHQAIGYVRDLVAAGYSWCVSIDLASFFDEIPHDLIFKLIRRKIADEGLVTLIARAVKAGVVVEGKFEKSTKGVPQGSPLSPILSNIVLNELDQELDHRGLKYARWADDFVVLVRSRRAAERAMENICAYLEGRLGLPVNREKSGVSTMSEVTFLGFRIYRHKIRISPESLVKFKDQVRELTHRNNPLSMYAAIQRLNRYLRGWVAYFGVQQFRELFGRIDPWIRNRLRSMQLAKWKKPGKFQRVMIAAGVPPWRARKTWVAMKAWRSVRREEVRIILGLDWFRKIGLVFLNDYTPAPSE
jgi:RNA-directed DNA polymerase